MTPARIATVPRRGLRREESALYVGVSATKFDGWVADGQMPKGFHVDGVVLWDVRDLDSAFEALKDGQGRNEWDEDAAA